MPSKLSAHLSSLPPPPKHNLNSHSTLGEIIDHISLLAEDFPHVDIVLLKKHLWRIRNKDVDPQTHLRGFLKVFQKTDVFKDAFEQLDEGMKRQILVFIAEGNAEHVMAVGREHGCFNLPPSPPVKRHFEEMVKKVEEFFHEDEETNGATNGANDHTNGVNGVHESNGHLPETNSHTLEVKASTNGVNGTPEDKGTPNEASTNEANGLNGTPESDGDFPKTNKNPQGILGPVQEINGHEVKSLMHTLSSHVFEVKEHASEASGQVNDLIDPVKPLSKAAPKEAAPRIFEDAAQTKTMEVYGNREFQNWGQSVQNTPRWTFIPKTVLGLQNLVKWAKLHNKRVRCSGYRHSWSHTFSQNDQILVSLLNLEEVNKLPDPMSIEPESIDPQNELKTITLAAPQGVVASSTEKALVRVG